MLWWVRIRQTKGSEGYMVRSFLRGLMECSDDDKCKDPHPTYQEFTRDYTPWRSNTTREVNELETDWLRPYGEVNVPIYLRIPSFPP